MTLSEYGHTDLKSWVGTYASATALRAGAGVVGASVAATHDEDVDEAWSLLMRLDTVSGSELMLVADFAVCVL